MRLAISVISGGRASGMVGKNVDVLGGEPAGLELVGYKLRFFGHSVPPDHRRNVDDMLEHRVRGIVRSMKTTQALTTPSVKVERADGEIVKIPFSSIIEVINHNHRG